MSSCNTAMYIYLLVLYFSPLRSKNTHLVFLKLAEMVNHSGKKIIVYMCWKVDNHKMFCFIFEQLNQSFLECRFYVWVCSEFWMEKKNQVWNLCETWLQIIWMVARNPDEHIQGESKFFLKAEWDGITLCISLVYQ